MLNKYYNRKVNINDKPKINYYYIYSINDNTINNQIDNNRNIYSIYAKKKNIMII